MKNNFENITAVMISFMRPEYTTECVRSVCKTYPGIKVLVGDNDKYNPDLAQVVYDHGGQYVVFPFDSGICRARNRLVEMVETDLTLVGDDDFFYTEQAGVDKMLSLLLSQNKIDLVGGRIQEGNNVWDYQGTVIKDGDGLRYITLDERALRKDRKSKVNWAQVDITFNYFLARTKFLRKNKWDEHIKVAFEHSDWFLSIREKDAFVAYTPDAIVIHKKAGIIPAKNSEYQAYRTRRSDQEYFFTKHKISHYIGFKGFRIDAEQWQKKQIRNKKPVENRSAMMTYYARTALFHEGKQYNKGDMITTASPTEEMIPA